MTAAISEVPEAAASSPPPADQSHLPPGQRKYAKIEPPTPQTIMAENFWNNCLVKSVFSGVGGAGMGVMFGVFMGTMETGSPVGTLDYQKQTMRQAFREIATNTISRSRSYAKGFAMVGSLFAGTECLIESYRARHDSMNPIYAGCASGAILAHSGGPRAMCAGCLGFAAFSAAIEKLLDH